MNMKVQISKSTFYICGFLVLTRAKYKNKSILFEFSFSWLLKAPKIHFILNLLW
jgi:hypothetical protein